MFDLDYLVTEGINGRVSTLLEGLSRGVAADYTEYCKLVGEIRGLRYAQQLVLDARAQLATGDE